MPPKNKQEYNAYMKDYMLARYHNRRALAKAFLGGECEECGSEENLEFDHIDPDDKSFSIAKMWSVNENSFWDEVEKCQLLCEEHHKVKHASKAKCGTVQRYWRGCRCQDCTKANAAHSREYKTRRNSMVE